MRRKVLAMAAMALTTLGLAVPYTAAETNSSPAGGSWNAGELAQVSDALVADDQVLVAFQERAQEEGALGFYRDEETSSLVVLVPSRRAGSFDLAKLGPASVVVTVKYSDLDASAVARATDRLLNLPKDLSAEHGSLAFFFSPQKQKIEVFTTFDRAVISDYLAESSSLIDYHYGEVEALTREDDSPAFWGGAKSHWLQDPDPTNYCTTSFTVIDSGSVKHMVQPAHCGPVGGTVKTWSGDYTVGTYGNKKCGNVGPNYNSDVQWISGQSYGRSIYIGGAAGTQANVTEAGNPGVGVAYRYSGAKTFENLNQVVISTNAQIWWDSDNDWCNPESVGGWWQLNLISWNRAGVCDTDFGDSGAPFYVKYGGTPPGVGIRGMATARVGNVCFGEKWSRIQSLLGGVSIYEY